VEGFAQNNNSAKKERGGMTKEGGEGQDKPEARKEKVSVKGHE